VAAQAIGHTTPLALKVQNNHGGQKRKIQWMLISDFLKLGKKTFLVSCILHLARLVFAGFCKVNKFLVDSPIVSFCCFCYW
jgi:hypothetical protein